MISRVHRFQGYASLRFVYQKGQNIRGPLLSLKFAANPKRSTYRAAVVVGRKVDKSAVIRNRLRRRIYEALRQLESEITGSYDLVFTVFDVKLDEISTADLRTLVRQQLSRAQVITDKTAVNRQNHGIVDTRKN